MQSRQGRYRAAERDRKRRRWLVGLGTLLVLGLAGVVAARTVDVGVTVEAVGRADPLLVGAAVLAYLASWPLRGRRYADVLAPMDRRLGSVFLTLAVLLSQTANLALPARAGDGVRAYVCNRRRDVPYASGAASLTVERCFDLLALVAIGGVALVVLLVTGDDAGATVLDAVDAATSAVGGRARSVAATAALVAFAAGALAVALAAGWRPDADPLERTPAVVANRLPDAGGLCERAVASARAVVADLSAVGTRPRSLAAVGAGSLAIWTLDAATAVLVLAAVSSAPLRALLVVGALAVAAGNLAKVLPLTQGGLGLYEGAFAATVVALSPVGGAVALAAAVLDHALKNGVTLAGGVLAGALLQVSPRVGPPSEASSPDR